MADTMTPRERVAIALDHREPDRIPFDMGGTLVTSITARGYVKLREFLGLPDEEVKIFDHVQQLPHVGEDLMERLGGDVRTVQIPYISSADQEYLEEGNYYYFIDRWGSKLRMPKEGGHYFDWVEFPVNDISMDALNAYKWPEPDTAESIEPLRQRAEHLWENTDYALAGTAMFGGGIFEEPARFMGMERFLTSLAIDEEFANAAMERVTELYIENTMRYLDALGRHIQVLLYWNDVSSQDGWMISPETYRRLVKPKDKRLFDAIRSKTDAKIFYHACGAARELIPDLIDIGVDIVNPVQVSARGMDTAELKREFGKDITFWGGGCDCQKVLPQGTPGEVRDEVKRRIDDLAPGGGFVFAPIHNIQSDVPPENIMAMVETFQEYAQY